jgi:hypothetical protein
LLSSFNRKDRGMNRITGWWIFPAIVFGAALWGALIWWAV